MRIGQFAGLAVLAILLAGCDAVTARTTHYTPAPAALQDKADCLIPSEWRPDYGPLDPQSRLMGSVPTGFVPVDAVRCKGDFGPPPHPPGATGTRMVEEHLAGDYTALLAALAEPSDHQDVVGCTSDAEALPNLWLVNAAGKAVHVMWPLDVCSKTRGKPDTATALDALTVKSSKTLEPVTAQ
jgi:hypothetical protein